MTLRLPTLIRIFNPSPCIPVPRSPFGILLERAQHRVQQCCGALIATILLPFRAQDGRSRPLDGLLLAFLNRAGHAHDAEHARSRRGRVRRRSSSRSGEMGHEGEGRPNEPVVGARASHDGGRGCGREVFHCFWRGRRHEMLADVFFFFSL